MIIYTMHIGALVAKKSRWGVDSQLIGLIVSRSEEGRWLVLWTLGDKKYKLQDHIASALIDLSKISDEIVKARTQITL